MSENSKENLKEKFKKVALAVTLTGAATSLNAKEVQNEMSTDASIAPTEVSAPEPAESQADSQTSMEFYSTSEYPDRLTEFCRNNNLHDIHPASYEFQRKLNHSKYSSIYIGYRNKTEWRYGQPCNNPQPFVIAIPHEPYDDIVLMDYRFAKESLENNTHIFDQTKRLQQEYQVNKVFRERIERIKNYRDRYRQSEQSYPRARNHHPRPQRNYSENSRNRSNSYNGSQTRSQRSQNNNTKRTYRFSRDFGR